MCVCVCVCVCVTCFLYLEINTPGGSVIEFRVQDFNGFHVIVCRLRHRRLDFLV